jgi:hypothetical protein
MVGPPEADCKKHFYAHQAMPSLSAHGRGVFPRTTTVLDDDLVANAQAYTGIEEKTALVREALKA